jgi:hypothetical protein
MGVKTISKDPALRATQCAPPSAAQIHRPIAAAGVAEAEVCEKQMRSKPQQP